MMKITRYWICGASSGYGCDAKAEPHPDGEYMLYSDHAAAGAEWQREREKLEGENKNLRKEMVAHRDKAAEALGDLYKPPGYVPDLIASGIKQLRAALSAAESISRVQRQRAEAIERGRPLCPDCRDKCRDKSCLRCRYQAAEQANAELLEALARVRANASIPHRVKQIVDEALGAAS